MILTVGGIKGGSGKTTVATNFACMAAAQNADVLLVDADEQETASDFTAVRKEDYPDATRYTCTKLTGKARPHRNSRTGSQIRPYHRGHWWAVTQPASVRHWLFLNFC